MNPTIFTMIFRLMKPLALEGELYHWCDRSRKSMIFRWLPQLWDCFSITHVYFWALKPCFLSFSRKIDSRYEVSTFFSKVWSKKSIIIYFCRRFVTKTIEILMLVRKHTFESTAHLRVGPQSWGHYFSNVCKKSGTLGPLDCY